MCFIGKLFHRVILMSGSALAPWAVVSDPARATLQVASTLNCTEEQFQAQKPNRGGGGGRGGRGGNIGDQSLLGCLRSVPLYQLMRAARPAALHQAAMAKQDHRWEFNGIDKGEGGIWPITYGLSVLRSAIPTDASSLTSSIASGSNGKKDCRWE